MKLKVRQFGINFSFDRKKAENIRKIIHIDMDAFYASVEQLDNPSLKGKPVAVGGSKERGVVAAASYEARKFGVHSAMPSSRAYLLCPNITFVKPRFERYKEISDQIRDIFHDYTDLVEPLSLDEAFLDVSENLKGIPSATLIAKAIKKEIKEQVQLTASAGISVNKFLAKVASDYNKPNGITLIGPEKVNEFLMQLPVKDFFGVGKVTTKKMDELGIFRGSDLIQWSKEALQLKFGKAGIYYYHMVRGNDDRPVNPHRIRKSLGAEKTFSENMNDLEDMKLALRKIIEEVVKRLEKTKKEGKSITLKIKFNDFSQITRSTTLEDHFNSFELIVKHVFQLLGNINWSEHPQGVRLLGVTISNFDQEEEDNKTQTVQQLTLEF